MTTPDRATRGADARRVVTGVEMRADRAADMVKGVARGDEGGGKGRAEKKEWRESAGEGADCFSRPRFPLAL